MAVFTIGGFLKRVGTAKISSIPSAGIVREIVEIALDRGLSPEVTGEEILAIVKTDLTAEVAERILTRELSAGALADANWSDVKERISQSKTMTAMQEKMLMVLAIALGATTVLLTAVFCYGYTVDQNYPTVEELLIVYGLPGTFMCAVFGIRIEGAQKLIMNIIINRLAQKTK